VRTVMVATLGVVMLLGTSCGFGSGTFSLSNASVDPLHVCPRGSHNSSYDLHVTADAHNGTSGSVAIKTVTAVLTVASVNGSWLQQVGSKYDAGSVSYKPSSIAAGTDTTLHVTIPSACTNNSSAASAASFADYTVTLAVTSSAGTLRVASQNRHRITAA
jgi:hypothetical protein